MSLQKEEVKTHGYRADDKAMNQELFRKLMDKKPSQHPPEWEMFLHICDAYLKKNNVKNPIVVELGILFGKQKKFYEQLLGARHIGIDSEDSRGIPEIKGFTDDPETIEKLKKELGGKPINILFIDASHRYNFVRRDFYMYYPFCDGIIALHDIETGRNSGRNRQEVWRLWDELVEESYQKIGNYQDHMFLSIRQCRAGKTHGRRMGIGVMIKNPKEEK